MKDWRKPDLEFGPLCWFCWLVLRTRFLHWYGPSRSYKGVGLQLPVPPNAPKLKMHENTRQIKTPSPKRKKQHQAITHSSSKHHSTITTHHGDFTETCPRRHQHITERSPKHHQKNKKQHQNNTETSPKTTETRPRHHRDETDTRPRQDRDTTET